MSLALGEKAHQEQTTKDMVVSPQSETTSNYGDPSIESRKPQS